MGFRVQTNVSSLQAQRNLQQTTNKQDSALSKLSSGKRITKAADDAAGLSISDKLTAQIRSFSQATRNANDGISMIQTAEGALGETSNLLVRMRELAMQASSDTVGDTERSFSNLEYQNIKEEIQRISDVTEFNGRKLLDGSGESYDFQIGINNNDFEDRITYNSTTMNSSNEELAINELDVLSKNTARETLNVVDQAISKISEKRSFLGALQNRLTSTVQNQQITRENLSTANSRILDTDYAFETANLTKVNILSSAGTSVLGQANVSPQSALKLIG